MAEEEIPAISGERLNQEPIIFRGCGSSEMTLIVLASVVVVMPIAITVAATAGAAMIGIGLSGGLMLVTVVLGATGFQQLKRNCPNGHYQQRVKIALDQAGLSNTHAILGDGQWDVGRSLNQRPNCR